MEKQKELSFLLLGKVTFKGTIFCFRCISLELQLDVLVKRLSHWGHSSTHYYGSQVDFLLNKVDFHTASSLE